MRLILYVDWDAFLEDPILGSGPGTFENRYAQTEYALHFYQEGMDMAKALRREAHNTYLEIVVGAGLTGLILFLGLHLQALRNYRQAKVAFRARGDPEGEAMVVTYRLAYVALLIFLLTFSELYQKSVLVSLALSQTALWVARTDGEERAADVPADAGGKPQPPALEGGGHALPGRA